MSGFLGDLSPQQAEALAKVNIPGVVGYSYITTVPGARARGQLYHTFFFF